MMPLGYSEISNGNNEIKENSKKKRKVKNKTIKKRTNSKVETFLNSMNSKETFEPSSVSRERSAGASTRKTVSGYDSDEELGEPYNNDLKSEEIKDEDKSLGPMQWDKQKLEGFGLLKEGLAQQEKYQKDQAQFYNQYVPTYTGTAQNIPYYSQLANSQNISGSRDELMRKLNYVVHMLEEQQDEKTGSVTEELVLYMFLGVFVIFVVDSFARVTKYTR